MQDPYPINTDDKFFETDHGIIYAYGFEETKISPLVGVYDIKTSFFRFDPDQNPQPDERVAPTIHTIINDFLDNSTVLLYVCDSTDKRASARQGLFKKWADRTPDAHLDELEFEVDTGFGIDIIYGGIVTRESFPHRELINSELVGKTPQLLQEKYT